MNKNKNIENLYKDDKIIKTNEKRIEDLKTQYKQLTNNNEKAMIMDLIQSLQNEIGQFNENKYAWEKENDYNYINFGLLNSIKSIEKEIEQFYNNKNQWKRKHLKEVEKVIHQMIYYIFVMNMKLNVLVMIGRCNNLLQTKMND